MSKSNNRKMSNNSKASKNSSPYKISDPKNHPGAPPGFRDSQGAPVTDHPKHRTTKDTLGKQNKFHRRSPAVTEKKSTTENNKTYLYVGVAAIAFLILYNVYR